MGCDCACHAKLEKAGIRGCCFKCEKEHDQLRNALDQVKQAKELVMKAGAGVGGMLEGAQDVLQEHRDRIAELALENGKFRKELGRAVEILSGREKADALLVSHEWQKMLGRFS